MAAYRGFAGCEAPATFHEAFGLRGGGVLFVGLAAGRA